MATWTRKIIAEWRDATIEGEPCRVALRRLTTVDILDGVQTARDVLARLTAPTAVMRKDDHERLGALVASWTQDVEGIQDEDGQPIVWAALSEADRQALICAIDPPALLELFTEATAIGRPDAAKKKRSSRSSSKPKPPAAAPDAPAPEKR